LDAGDLGHGLARRYSVPDDGSGRMFIIEQDGRIRIVENGQMLDPPFLDIISKVDSLGNEQGLLGLAFHPGFNQNPYFYVTMLT